MLTLAGLTLVIPGLAIEALVMPGLVIPGFVTLGFTTVSFWKVELVMPGLVIPGLVMPGFVIPGLVMLGFVIPGFVMSGLSVVLPVSPFGTRVPCGAVISAMSTVTLAVGSVETTKTGREALDRGGMLKSSVVNGENCRKEAFPPAG